MADAVEQVGARVDEHVAVRGHVDDAVVGGDEEARATRHPSFERGELGIELLEDHEPSIGLPAMRVRRLVELGHVQVDERARLAFEQRSGLGEAVGDARGRSVRRTAQHRAGEARVGVTGGADRETRDAGVGCRLEERRLALPRLGRHSRVPAVQLVDEAVVRRVEHAVSDEPVLPRHPTGREARDRGRGGRRRHRADHVSPRHPRGQESRVARPGLDVRCTEAVDEHDHRTRCRGQPEVVLLATETLDGTGEHPGKPRSGDGGHR